MPRDARLRLAQDVGEVRHGELGLGIAARPDFERAHPRHELGAAILRVGSWTTVLGNLAFDAKGDPTKPDYAIYIVSGGKIGELKM